MLKVYVHGEGRREGNSCREVTAKGKQLSLGGMFLGTSILIFSYPNYLPPSTVSVH